MQSSPARTLRLRTFPLCALLCPKKLWWFWFSMFRSILRSPKVDEKNNSFFLNWHKVSLQSTYNCAYCALNLEFFAAAKLKTVKNIQIQLTAKICWKFCIGQSVESTVIVAAAMAKTSILPGIWCYSLAWGRMQHKLLLCCTLEVFLWAVPFQSIKMYGWG